MSCEIKCGGRCCKGFMFPFTLEELDRDIEAIKNGKDFFLTEKGDERRVVNDPDVEFIREMLVYKGISYVNPTTGENFNVGDGFCKDKFEVDGDKIRIDKDRNKYCLLYTCKHLKEDGLCGVYDNRPKMCRNYPYYGDVTRKCEYKDCCKETKDESKREESD